MRRRAGKQHGGYHLDRVFVYWDNSNLIHEALRLAEEREGTPGARYLIRIHFENLLRLAEAGRPLAKAVAAGSVHPEMRQLWNRMGNRGVQVRLFDRGERGRGEQETPNRPAVAYSPRMPVLRRS